MNASIAERFARTNMYLNMEIAKEEEDEDDYGSYGEETQQRETNPPLQKIKTMSVDKGKYKQVMLEDKLIGFKVKKG